MKRIFTILGLCFAFALTSCSFTENKTMVSFSKDANRIQFYVYKVKGNIRMLRQDGTIVKSDNKEIEIIDSEATSITYIR